MGYYQRFLILSRGEDCAKGASSDQWCQSKGGPHTTCYQGNPFGLDESLVQGKSDYGKEMEQQCQCDKGFCVGETGQCVKPPPEQETLRKARVDEQNAKQKKED